MVGGGGGGVGINNMVYDQMVGLKGRNISRRFESATLKVLGNKSTTEEQTRELYTIV